EARCLWDRATEVLARAQLSAVQPLVAALDDGDPQSVAWAARSIQKLAELAERPERDLRTALESVVPKLEELLCRSVKKASRRRDSDQPDAYLGALEAIAKSSAKAAEAVVRAKLLAKAGKEW